MTPIELYPGIVWTRDAYAERAVARWQLAAADGTRQFVRAACTWEDVRDLLRLYAGDEFREVLLSAGVKPTQMGVVVNVVIVATGMGAQAYTSAAEDAVRLQRLENEVTGLRRHVVLLAQHDGLPNSERFVCNAEGLPVPWLVSSRGSDGRTRKDETIARRLGDILDVLLLVAPSVRGGDPAALQEIGGAVHAVGHVRLAGSSTIDFARQSKCIAAGCLAYVLESCSARTNTAPHLADELCRSCEGLVAGLVRGEIALEQFLDRVIGDGGLCAWDVRTILVEGHAVLSRLVGNDSVLARAARGDFDEYMILARPAPNPWWKRLLQAIGLMRKPPQEVWRQLVGQRAESAAALARLQAAHGFLEEVAKVARPRGRSSIAPPTSYVGAWLRGLESRIRSSLRDVVRGTESAQYDAEGIIRELADRIEADVVSNLSTAIREWSNAERSLDEVRTLMASDRFVTFDAQVAGGSFVKPATAIGTFAMGNTVTVHGQDVAYARVACASGVRPFFFVASEAIADSSLAW